MRKAIRQSIEMYAKCFQPTGPVVEVEAKYLPGYELLSDLRPVFKKQPFYGCDMRAGLGVDLRGDGHSLCFATGSIGTILLLDILEHVPFPDKVVNEAHRVLDDQGHLVVSVPFQYRLHGFPTDYWRFTASGIRHLLSPFSNSTVFSLGPRLKPSFIFGIASNTAPEVFSEKQKLFQDLISQEFSGLWAQMNGTLSVLKERGRDFFGCLLGRSELSVNFFDPMMKGGYINTQARQGMSELRKKEKSLSLD